MFGRLPARYRAGLVASAIIFFVVAGAWVAQSTPVLVPPWGSVVGALMGVAAAFVLVHDFHRHATRTARTTHRPRR